MGCLWCSVAAILSAAEPARDPVLQRVTPMQPALAFAASAPLPNMLLLAPFPNSSDRPPASAPFPRPHSPSPVLLRHFCSDERAVGALRHRLRRHAHPRAASGGAHRLRRPPAPHRHVPLLRGAHPRPTVPPSHPSHPTHPSHSSRSPTRPIRPTRPTRRTRPTRPTVPLSHAPQLRGVR